MYEAIAFCNSMQFQIGDSIPEYWTAYTYLCAPQMIIPVVICVSNTVFNLHQNVFVVVDIILHLITEPA